MGQIERTDAELVEASRRGEREAFGQLVSRYQDVVCAVSYSGTGNWALSEDVAQDTFIAAWRQLGQLREIGRLRAWLCGIARNLARKARQRTARDVDIDDEQQMPALDASPFDAAAQAEVDRVVRDALARIPAAYRETLVLYYCENRSVREVAQTLGIAEDAAMQRLSRGRKYLADGVTELVERSLRGANRPRKDLRPAVLAALPHVGPAPTSRGSNMWKVSLAAAALLLTGVTASVIALSGGAPPRPVAAKPATSVATVTGDAPHTPYALSIAMATPPTKAPHAAPALPTDDDAPIVVPKSTREQLGLERGPSRGPKTAPVTIVVFQDLLCEYCGLVLGTIDELWDEYPGKLRLVVKQFPVHKAAILAAEASLAADAQGKFWELHDAMMAHQDDLSRDAIVGYARDAGLDANAIADALDHHTYASALKTEARSAAQIGVRATPAFLINGKLMVGNLPIAAFRDAIDAALAEGITAINP